MFLAVQNLFASALADLVKMNDDFERQVVRDDLELTEQYGIYFKKPELSYSLNFIRRNLSKLRELADQVPVENISRIPIPPQYNNSYKIGIGNIEEGLKAYVRKLSTEATEIQKEYYLDMCSVCSEKRDYDRLGSNYFSRRSILRTNSKAKEKIEGYNWFRFADNTFSDVSFNDKYTAEDVYKFLEANLFELVNYKLVLEPIDYKQLSIRYRRTLFVPFRKTRFAGFIRKTLDKLPV